MAIGFVIRDGRGDDTAVSVTPNGELIVATKEFSKFYTNTTTVANTAVNVVAPKTGKQFVITDMVISGDRSIGVNGAVTDIFEADDDSTGTIDTQIFQDEIAKQTRVALAGLRIIVSSGKWVNAKSDDVQVRVNIAGYYVDS